MTVRTGSPVALSLRLRTAGTFDVSPPWDSGTWNVVVEPDGSLEADGVRLSHLHYDLETVASWQRQSGSTPLMGCRLSRSASRGVTGQAPYPIAPMLGQLANPEDG